MEERRTIEITVPEKLNDEDLEQAAGGCWTHHCETVYYCTLDRNEDNKYMKMVCKDCGQFFYYKYYPDKKDYFECGPEEFNWAQNSGRITGQQFF